VPAVIRWPCPGMPRTRPPPQLLQQLALTGTRSPTRSALPPGPRRHHRDAVGAGVTTAKRRAATAGRGPDSPGTRATAPLPVPARRYAAATVGRRQSQGGAFQALVAPLVPGERPEQRPSAHYPRPAVPGDAVLGQIALDSLDRWVAGQRQGSAVPLDAQLQAGAEVAARTPQVLHGAAEEEPLGAGEAVLTGPDQPPLVGAAGGQTAVPTTDGCR
jgi:hypothetical protein